jgi:hypothetical protein
MQIGDIMVRQPQLTHRKAIAYGNEVRSVVDREHYALHVELPIGGEKESYTLVVRYYWDGEVWNHYSFGKWDDNGEFEEIFSKEEADSHEEAYLNNGGKLEEFYRPRVIRGIETDIKAALIRRWEAVCELVSPHVTF